MRTFAVLLALVLAAPPAYAGDRDTHLAMTHYLARRAGLSEGDAALVARADWSMDLNLSTTALPVVEPGKTWSSDLDYQARGATYHSMGDNAGIVRAHVEALRRAIPGPDAPREARLMAVGQYLHSLQDVYFHQHDGVPYEPKMGHAHMRSSERGHETDAVPGRYDAALLALDESARVLSAVAQRAAVPEVKWDRAYESRSDRITGSFAKQFEPEIVKLASAVSRAYDVRPPAADDINTEQSKDGFRPRLNDERLGENLKTLWRQNHQDTFEPFVDVTRGPRGKVDYDADPALLAVHVPGAATTAPASTPGGISFTAAAATRLPIQLDLQAIWAGDGRIVLSGRSADGAVFDAARLLTSFRLACGHGDPYFSLDPVDGAAWQGEVTRGAEGWIREHEAQLVQPPLLDRAIDGSIGQVSFRRAAIEGEAVTVAHPGLMSKLVFSPAWLRDTQVGKVLYEADVLLKVLASGLSVQEGGRTIPAPSLPMYHSGGERMAVGLLLQSANGVPVSQPMSGVRLWFQLGPESVASPFTVRPFDLAPVFALPSFTPAPQTPVDRLRARLASAGLVSDQSQLDLPSINAARPVVHVSGGSMDLSSVWPHMAVRRHDAATRTDVEGEDPSLKAVAADVNGRIAEWAREYPELQALVDVLRMYVAAVRITEADQSICQAVSRTPILPSETVDVPLPDVRPSIIALAALSLRVETTDSGEQTVAVPMVFVNGGISLGMKGSPNAVEYSAERTTEMERLEAAARDDSVDDSGVLRLRFDLPESSGWSGRFVPVTEADVLGAVSQPLALSLRQMFQSRLIALLDHRIAGVVVMMPIVGAGFVAVGAVFMLFHKGPIFGRRARRRRP